MPIRKPVAIPQPKVRVGDHVSAENYRRKDKAMERGRVLRVEFVMATATKGSWHYTVLLERKFTLGIFEDARPTILRLYVRDEQVKFIRVGRNRK